MVTVMRNASSWNSTHISGAVIPRVAFMKSRVLFTAMRMLSVPPDVMFPQTCPPEASSLLPRNDAVMFTTSDSKRGILGNTSGCRGFVCANLKVQIIRSLSTCNKKTANHSFWWYLGPVTNDVKIDRVHGRSLTCCKLHSQGGNALLFPFHQCNCHNKRKSSANMYAAF